MIYCGEVAKKALKRLNLKDGQGLKMWPKLRILKKEFAYCFENNYFCSAQTSKSQKENCLPVAMSQTHRVTEQCRRELNVMGAGPTGPTPLNRGKMSGTRVTFRFGSDGNFFLHFFRYRRGRKSFPSFLRRGKMLSWPL